jgi:hypothetical protein
MPDPRRQHHTQATQRSTQFLTQLPPIVADVLDVAASIMWADRYRLRPRKYGAFRLSRGWVRQFRLTLGVRTPDLWNSPAMKDVLERFLTWLREDTWHPFGVAQILIT